ncbi:class D beta-lactamase [Methylomonas sp. LWB]|uniref:class D beta-lactamase n=1 Tax=Methylomonas sp. LWB TaxID=1905845 RepID=UPI0020C8A8F5|nr:class D beta-lactamase [Methylomonas sp. LWB]
MAAPTVFFPKLSIVLKTALLCLLAVWPSLSRANDPSLAALFAERQLSGTLIIATADGSQRYVHNDARASQRYASASTFKILNTLIALEEGAIDSNEVLKWDGVARSLPDWNRDHTLASAFKTSCVWCYQVLARRIGGQAYRSYLDDIDYGRLASDFNPTEFWLNGDLQISAAEQIEFLKKLQSRALPFADEHFETLRNIMLVERTPTYALRAKTGWAARGQPQIGWYVGSLETAAATWLFALNIDLRSEQDLPLRAQLLRAALRAKGIADLPP